MLYYGHVAVNLLSALEYVMYVNASDIYTGGHKSTRFTARAKALRKLFNV